MVELFEATCNLADASDVVHLVKFKGTLCALDGQCGGGVGLLDAT